MESPEQKAKRVVNEAFDPNFEEKFEKVRPVLERYAEEGKLDNIAERAAELKTIREKNEGSEIDQLRSDILQESNVVPKYVDIRNEKTGRNILFSREAIEEAKNRSGIEDLLKVPNELANNLNKEEQLLAYIHSERAKVQSELERFNSTGYIDSITDQYKDATHAGAELRSEHDFLRSKLDDLTIAESKTKEAIDALEQKLSE